MSRLEAWHARLVDQLRRFGVDAAEADRLATRAVADAVALGKDPAAMYGPASSYAQNVAESAKRGYVRAPSARQDRGPLRLRLRGVSKSYRTTAVLSDIDLDVHAGEVAAVVGANGSGKSTLLRICAGQLAATSGTVQRTTRIGYVPQHGGTADLLTPDEHFLIFGAAAGIAGADAVARGRSRAEALGWRPAPTLTAGRLSGGTRQKLNVVLGALDDPELILLDEPYQGFDQASYVDLWDQIYRWRDAGVAVVVVTHLLHDHRRVNQVIELHAASDRAEASG